MASCALIGSFQGYICRWSFISIKCWYSIKVCFACGHHSSSVLQKKKCRTAAVEGAFRCSATTSEIQNINWGQMLLISLNCYICTVTILVYCLHLIYCDAGASIVIDFWLYVFVHTQTCHHLVEALWNYFNPVHMLSWCCMRLIKYGCTAEGVQIPTWWAERRYQVNFGNDFCML